MPKQQAPMKVAVIGAGLAGAACAQGLRAAGLQVTLFEKSRGVGGRMATRRAHCDDAQGVAQTLSFDHGAQHFTAVHPRFRAMTTRAEAAGVLARWQPKVHAAWPAPVQRHTLVATPGMPALCRHLLKDIAVQADHPVQRLHRTAKGWQVVVTDNAGARPMEQRYAHVMLAMPPAQAAILLAGHHDSWADALASLRMEPCWTLMAATDEVDWPWDAAEPASGPLAWVVRNDRKPGRSTVPGLATWVAHATPAWSLAHLEASPKAVGDAMKAALAALLPTPLASGRPLNWHHTAVHRWRHANPASAAPAGDECWWDRALGLGVCGDFLAGGGVEAAWRSGDELADTAAASLEEVLEVAEAV
jgi:renalase